TARVNVVARRGGERWLSMIVAVYAQRTPGGAWYLLAVSDPSRHQVGVEAARDRGRAGGAGLFDSAPESLLLRRYACFEDVLEVLPADNGVRHDSDHLFLPDVRGLPVGRTSRLARAAGRSAGHGSRRRPQTRRFGLVAAATAFGLLLAWADGDE
ncbi:MAG TPA: hypothetical protein VFX49_06255, partial [Chloroflexota bacterium]|nr:hypothetical protein [Chloroflexota bacterium]